MVPAGEPEVARITDWAHRRPPWPGPADRSPPQAPPTTPVSSTNAKTRSRFVATPGASVRKLSRMSPPSCLRASATTMPSVWIADGGSKRDLLLGCRSRNGDVRGAEALDEAPRQKLDAPLRGPARSPRPPEPASTSRASRCPGSPLGRPRAPCLQGSQRPSPQTRRFPGQPIRRAPPRARRRTYRTGRAGSCAAASRPRPSRCGIEPGRHGERGTSVCRSGSALPRHRTSRSPSTLSDGMAPFSMLKVVEILPIHGGKLACAPSVERQHQVPREALDEPARAQIVEALLLRARLPAAAGPLPPSPGRQGEWWRRTPASQARRLRRSLPARPAARRRPGRHRRRSHRASRWRWTAPAGRAPTGQSAVPPCRHRRRGARLPAARPAPERRRTPKDRSGRHCTSVPAPRSEAIAWAWAKASPTSRRVTRRNGGGKSSADAELGISRAIASRGARASCIGAFRLGRL